MSNHNDKLLSDISTLETRKEIIVSERAALQKLQSENFNPYAQFVMSPGKVEENRQKFLVIRDAISAKNAEIDKINAEIQDNKDALHERIKLEAVKGNDPRYESTISKYMDHDTYANVLMMLKDGMAGNKMSKKKKKKTLNKMTQKLSLLLKIARLKNSQMKVKKIKII